MADGSIRTPGTGETIRTVDKGVNGKTEVAIIDGGGTGAEALILGDAANGLDVDVTRVSGTVTVGQGTGTNLHTVVDSGSITVSSVGGTVTADTELPAAAALAENVANPTAPAVGVFGMLWDGATWDRAKGDSTDGQLVNLGANNDVTVTSGSITADTELPTAAALNADNVAAPTAPAVGAFNMVYDGANYDRMRGDSTDGTLVNLGANNDVTVTGTVTANAGSGPFPVSDNAGSLTVDAPVGTPVNVKIGDGTNTAGIKDVGATDALMVAIVDGAGTQITSFGGGTQYAEDAIHNSGDLGTMALAVQKTANAALAADGDYAPLQVDATGYLKVNVVTGGTAGAEFAEDTPHNTGDLGTMALAVQKTADASLGADGDYEPLQVDATGYLKVNVKTGTTTVTQGTGTNLHTVVDSGSITADTELPAAAAMGDTISRTLSTVQIGAMNMLDNGANFVRAPGDLTNGMDVDVTRVTGTVTVDSELPAAAAMSDTISRTLSTPQVGSLLMIDNATNYVRAPGDLTNGLDVDVTRVSGTVTVSDSSNIADDAAFTVATSKVTPAGFLADQTSTDSVDEGDVGAARMTLDRQQLTAAATAPTATLANVSASATNVTVLAANVNRKGLIIVNDGSSVAYLKFGATATSTSFSYKLNAGDTLELPTGPVIYTGIIDGIWVTASGSARVTELT